MIKNRNYHHHHHHHYTILFPIATSFIISTLLSRSAAFFVLTTPQRHEKAGSGKSNSNGAGININNVHLPSWSTQPPILKTSLIAPEQIEDSREALEGTCEENENDSDDEDDGLSSLCSLAGEEDCDLYFCYEKVRKNKQKLPPWLEVLREQDLEIRMKRLRASLSKSYLVNDQTEDVLRALKESCDNDPIKMSGVAELCLPLIESMEMDRDTIIAAAFHYNSCLTVREKMLDYYMYLAYNGNDVKANNSRMTTEVEQTNPRYRILDIDESTYLLPLAGSGIEDFGNDVVKIALNAAKIKRSEVVSRKSVSNYRTEAHNLRSMLLSVTGDWRSLAIRANASLFRMRGLLRARSSNRINASLKDTFRNIHYEPLTKDEICEGKEALYIYAPLAHRLGMHRLKSELESTAFELIYRRQHNAVWSLYLHDGWSGTTRERFVKASDLNTIITDIPSRTKSFDELQSDIINGESGSTGEGMRNVLNEVTKRVKRRLREDDTFMNAIASVTVTARIKEPFSLWKKLLKLRLKKVREQKELRECTNYYAPFESIISNNKLNENKVWSVFDVPDACALRIIIKVRKLTPDEEPEVTRARDRSLCYYVRDLCAERWPSTDSLRSKDYIIDPKENGYQSLHYSTSMRWHGEDWPFEVQVRSKDMHRVAEYGIAAHWNYKVGGEISERPKPNLDGYTKATRNNLTNDDSDDFVAFSLDTTGQAPLIETYEQSYERHNRVERALAQKERLEPYLTALSEARTDLNLENIFVFLIPQQRTLNGGVLSLPVGACVMDALREALKRYGEDIKWKQLLERRNMTLLCNGEPVSLTKRLRTGDVLTVPSIGDENKIENDVDIFPSMHV